MLRCTLVKVYKLHFFYLFGMVGLITFSVQPAEILLHIIFTTLLLRSFSAIFCSLGLYFRLSSFLLGITWHSSSTNWLVIVTFGYRAAVEK